MPPAYRKVTTGVTCNRKQLKRRRILAMAAYTHTNTKGVTYFLHSKAVTLRGGKLQTIYFFAKDERPDDAVSELPAGYMVQENPRNGFLTLKKAPQDPATQV